MKNIYTLIRYNSKGDITQIISPYNKKKDSGKFSKVLKNVGNLENLMNNYYCNPEDNYKLTQKLQLVKDIDLKKIVHEGDRVVIPDIPSNVYCFCSDKSASWNLDSENNSLIWESKSLGVSYIILKAPQYKDVEIEVTVLASDTRTKIAELKKLLASTDHKVLPDYEFKNGNTLESVKKQRQNWRKQLRSLLQNF